MRERKNYAIKEELSADVIAYVIEMKIPSKMNFPLRQSLTKTGKFIKI